MLLRYLTPHTSTSSYHHTQWSLHNSVSLFLYIYIIITFRASFSHKSKRFFSLPSLCLHSSRILLLSNFSSEGVQYGSHLDDGGHLLLTSSTQLSVRPTNSHIIFVSVRCTVCSSERTSLLNSNIHINNNNNNNNENYCNNNKTASETIYSLELVSESWLKPSTARLAALARYVHEHVATCGHVYV